MIGRLLASLDDRMAQRWSLEAMALEAGVSRATLVRRFRDVVGAAPMAYLTEQRMRRAGDLLATTTTSVESVGRRVGYPQPFAFSAAFRRHTGRSPSQHRAVARGTGVRGAAAHP